MIRVRGAMRYLFVTALVAMLTFGSIAAIAAQDASPEATELTTSIDKVGFITPAAITNLGWDQQGAEGANAAAAAFGIEALIQENGGYDDITPALKDLADEGAGLILCHASGYQTTCPDFAESSGVPVSVIENPDAVGELVADIETQAQEVAYLAGVLSGLTTKTGTVGVVVSGEPPTWNYMTVGFAEGLKASNQDAKLIYSVIGEAAYDDAAGAKRVTEQQLAAGADIIFGMGDGASFGMIEAIREFNEANADTPAWFIDVIGDKSADYSDVLLTSVLFDYTNVFEQIIANVGTPEFGQVYTMDVANGGVRLLDLPDSVSQDVQDKVEAAKASILDGSITVDAIGDAEGVKTKLTELGYA